ncbi:MAG TPA: stage III sporulation protein AG [Halanaerobiaceae bacterium]|jgi:stage III sporulation protein AG|nr:stage III sporulation protein AG [Bacillota bacterium]HHU92879.1 stage III sporulation protein AG [Halanaerobiaceae bacterium]HOA41311.1 stage III sporulation protein AG [Halanaerobiales bacterium]HPZ63501.1 stage III sporulation protein AG [Halanaerobiales bacterium]HQD03958.1 stage III sporulation protein AG [Halanaerobiales bacterium]
MGVLDELKKIFSFTDEGEGKNSKFIRNIIIIGLIGIFLLLFGDLFTGKKSRVQETPVYQQSKEVQVEVDYEARLSSQLEEIISLIRGVGKVKVKIYVRGYKEIEYEYNSRSLNKVTSELDQNGGQREIVEDNLERELVLTRDGSGNERPIIRRERFPEIEGVLIVAQGAENSQVKAEIIYSVRNLLNIPVHRISVLPYERG